MSVVGVEIRQKVCTSRADGGHQRVAYKVRMRTRVFGVCGSTSAMQEDVLFCAWSKNAADNSNYGLRGAGECCLVPTITKFERTQLRIERCGAGECCLVPEAGLEPAQLQ